MRRWTSSDVLQWPKTKVLPERAVNVRTDILQVPKCHKNLKRYCLDTSDWTMCNMWFEFCVDLWDPVVSWIGRNR